MRPVKVHDSQRKNQSIKMFIVYHSNGHCLIIIRQDKLSTFLLSFRSVSKVTILYT